MMNPRVFARPADVMENLAWVTRHLAARLRAEGIRDWQRHTLTLIPTLEGRDWLAGDDGAAWRMFEFQEGTLTRLTAATPDHARATGAAFGRFLALMADYDGPPLHETISGFHDTAARFQALERAVAGDRHGRAAGVAREIAELRSRQELSGTIPRLVDAGELPFRVVHNDAKIANVLFDADTGLARCVIDLDTVMVGSALHDFGDLVRSTVCPAAEDEPDLSRVRVVPDFYRAVQRGFLEAAGATLTPRERDLLPFAGKLITLEQAVRFLTDHLEGDSYYGAARPGHNLDRARVQLRLLEELERLETAGNGR